MEFRVLGPLDVRDGERVLPLGGAKQRAVLAILLLRHDEVVSRDRLVDGVWGDAPPASAAHTLEVYISRLRKALHRGGEPERLLTRPPGYLLRVGDGELDLQRLEALMEDARRALAADDPHEASIAMSEGLALFRGAPLEDLSYAPFSQAELGRLDDLRLAALELRIDADIATGRDAELIGELRALVARYPLRERFWCQLMLVLYRSGGQSEALETFDRARHELAEQLGIDPGLPLQHLHQRILCHDPALEPPTAANEPSLAQPTDEPGTPPDSLRSPPSLIRRVRRARRSRLVILTGAVVVASLVLVAALVSTAVRGSGRPGIAPQFRPGLAIIDLNTGDQTAFISPSNVDQGGFTYADGHFWGAGGDPNLVVEIDPTTGTVVRRFSPTLADVGTYAVGGSALWEVGGTALVKIDIRGGKQIDRYPLPRGDPNQTGIAVADSSLWVTRGGAGVNEVLKIDPESGRIVRRYPVPDPTAIAVANGTAWTVSHFSGVTVLDLATGQVRRVGIPLGPLKFVVAGGGYGWVADEARGVVYKIAGTGGLAATYQTGEGAYAMSYADGVLWVANGDVGTVTGINAVTGATRTFRFHHPTPDIGAGAGHLLVSVKPGRTYEDLIASLPGRVAKVLVQPYQLADGDPALDSTWLAFQVEYATCAKLLNHPDLAGPSGAQLRPEIAASMPTLSRDARTYTFTIRPGYRFSPPSNQPLTAETFRSSIERAISPRMGNDAVGPQLISDITGEAAYRAGHAEHISGLKARGDTLTIRLMKPSGDFLQRLAAPIFCPVPIGTPVGEPDVGATITTSSGQLTVPSAGPYYISDANAGEYLILKRNPNYTGPRPHALDAIALREGIDPGHAIQRVENGSWDGVMNLYDPLLDPTGPVAQKWGPDSQSASNGDQRYIAVPMPGVEALAFNAGRPPFSDPTVRRAAALALDRSGLAENTVMVNHIGDFSVPEAPSSQLLPPSQPGYRTDQDPYPPSTSNLAKARALMRGRHLTATLAIPGNCETCLRWARTLQYQLAEIGITVRIKAVGDPPAAVRRPGTGLDMIETSATQDYADPAAFLETLVGHDIPTSWLPHSVHDELSTLRHSVGEARIDAAGMLAHQLATVQVPATAFAYQVNGQLFSPRLGCRIFPPFGYGVDLAALCLPHS